MRAEKVVEVLRQAEWAADGVACPLCYSLPGEGHDEDCKLAALLDEALKEKAASHQFVEAKGGMLYAVGKDAGG